MTLFVHRATSTEVLANDLAELLADPLPDPFAEEVVAVPTKGVERWLAQRLSHRLGAGADVADPVGQARTDGVCAGVRFLNPHSLVALVLGIESGDPWHPDQLAWPVLRAIDDSLGEPWATTLSDHLGHGEVGIEGELRRGRRYAVARRLAGLFADYAAQRPAMLADWRDGGASNSLGAVVDEDLAWQPELWRRVLDLIDAEAPEERLARVVTALRAGDLGGLSLPDRLSLFGHTRIARSELEVLSALAEHRDIHLWLPQASPAAWSRLVGTSAAGPVPRSEDDSGLLVEHPLLASLGRDSRELQRTLAAAGGQDLTAEASLSAPEAPTLLSLLQGDIAADHAASAQEREARVVPTQDRSIQIHACHGQTRQVEVLRDVITGLLEQDPTLEPRDILVMCPDVETFAPLIHAAFGMAGIVAGGGPGADLGDEAPAGVLHPAHTFRVRIADRGPTHTNPLLALADRLVLLAGGRLTAGEVLDLARSAPVRRRFGLDDDALDRLTDWAAAVSIRWGLDADHRAMYRLQDLSQNTWRSGLDRILVGATVDGEDVDHVGTTLGLDDLDSGDIELAGRLTELVTRLGESLERMRAASTATQWVEVLRESVLELADVPRKELWQVTQLEHELARLATSAGAVGTTLGLADVHALLQARGAGRATRSSFRTGALTVCTMMPMRSVPHRVIALVGLDDGVFPRSMSPDGDDVLARQPVTGERDLRSEDRQLLLDALMSAGQALVITYAGFDEHSGQRRPPAVPVGELIDAVRRTACGEGVDRLVSEHPLQAFDARNLGATPDGVPPLLPGDRPFSHDPVSLLAARTAIGVRRAPLTPADVTLTAAVEAEVELAELVRFFDSPAKAYLRTRLGMALPEVPEAGSEGIPIELDGLASWAIGDRVLQSVLAGRDVEAVCDAELWRGELPPHALGWQKLEQIITQVKDLTRIVWQVAGVGRPGVPLPREVIDVDILLPSGRRVIGSVPGLVTDKVITATFSTARNKQRLRSWITSLALAAAGTGHSSHLIGQQRAWGKVKPVHYIHGGHDVDRALELLDQLVDLRDRGLRGPIPLPAQTAYAWAETFLAEGRDEDSAWSRARSAWVTTPSDPFAKEQHDLSHQAVYGGVVPLDAIVGTPAADEVWEADVTSRLGQLALRVWRPVLEDGRETKVLR